MAPQPSGIPAFVGPLVSGTAEDAKAALARVHPDFAARASSWQVLLDSFEGSGGFLDGSYLWPYLSELPKQFSERKTMARYHNYVEALIDLYVRFIWTQGVQRSSTNQDYNAWTQNVDGAGTPIDDLLKRYASVALVHGHAGTLVDKTQDEADGPTKADEKATVVASVFTAIAIPDWRFDRGELTAVKLFEAAPLPDITQEVPTGTDAVQYLLWDLEGWARFDAKGRLLSAGTPDLGLVPLVILRPKPSYTSPMLGRPLISNANVVRAIFNRASEEDEVIRAGAFSLLTVSVGPDGNVDAAKAQLGDVLGSLKAVVTQGTIDYKTPDQTIPATIRSNIEFLVKEIYRAAHVRYQRDSLSAESGEAIRLQFSELNEMLQGLGKALASAEQQIARAWFAWTFPTFDAAQAAFEAAKVEAKYPNEFFLDALINDLEAWAEAIRMDLGETMTKRLKKRAVRRLDPAIPEDELETIDKEIDAQEKPEPMPTTPLDTGDPEGAALAQAAKAQEQANA